MNSIIVIVLCQTFLGTLADDTDDLKTELANLKLKQDTLEKGLIPTGFIYIQLPDQLSAPEIWPAYGWQNVSEVYSGLFFRVEGGGSELFGTVQEQQGRTLSIRANGSSGLPVYLWRNGWIDIDVMAANNKYVQSGNDAGNTVGLQLKYGQNEIRPRNQAVRVWKRVD